MAYLAPIQLEHPDTGDLWEGTRFCRECLERKPITQFPFTTGGHYRRRKCETCVYVRQVEVRTANPHLYKGLVRWWHILRKYNMTEEEFWQKLLDQEGRCGLCRLPLPQEVSLIHIDHNHFTGRNRGLLHPKCNRGLGHFDDSPERLRLAAAYLEDDDS